MPDLTCSVPSQLASVSGQILFCLVIGLQSLNIEASLAAEPAAEQKVNFEAYRLELSRLVRRAWFPVRGMADNRALLRWTIDKNGAVSNIRITQSSGIAEVDSAAAQAIHKASPFPPLPHGAPDRVDVEYLFDYKASINPASDNRKQSSLSNENQRLASKKHECALAVLSGTRADKTDLEQAVAAALSAANLEPDNAAHWFLAALLYQKLSTADARALVMSEKMLNQSVEVNPKLAAGWLELGLMMAVQERGMESISAFENALEADPAATAKYAIGPLCAMYAENDEGRRGLDFFEEQFEAHPEVRALGVGRALMLKCLGDRKAALSQARDLLLFEKCGTVEHAYIARLVSEWER